MSLMRQLRTGAHVTPMTGRPAEENGGQRTDLACSQCGYGVARPTPPRQCPMCQTRDAWVHTRRFGARFRLADVVRR